MFFAGVCALMFTPASAQFLTREKASQNKVTAPVSLQSEAPAVKKAAEGKKQGFKMQLLSVKKADGTNPYAKYGDFEELLYEDFSKLTTGSIGNPDFNTNLYDPFKRTDPYDNSQYEIPWYSFNPDYLNTKGVYDSNHETDSRWGVNNGFPAGGALYMYLQDDDEDCEFSQCHVNTCLIDCSKYQGDVLLQFDAFTDNAESTNFISQVEAAETNGMGPSWNVLGSVTLPEINSERKTYTILFRGADKSTIFNIVGQRGALERGGDIYGNSFYIDNIKVSVLKPFVNAPENLKMKYYKGDNFKLAWDKVEGADKYLVDVYTKQVIQNDMGYTQETIGDYLLQDEETTDNFLQVNNAKNGEVYYYRVRAMKGNQVSMESNEEKQILGVVAPALELVDSYADSKYTAMWKPVPGAERYNYQAFAANKITEDTKLAVVNTNFEGMPYNHGFEWKVTSWGNEIVEQYDTPKYSTTDPDPSAVTGTYTCLDKMSGWMAYSWALYKDALVIDGYQSFNNGNNASLQCAPMDLSKDNGKFDVTITLKGECADGYVDENNNPVYAHAALATFVYDQELDDYVQGETKFIADTNDKEWKTTTCSFSNGSEDMTFGVFATYAPSNLYIHDIKIEQNYKAGDTFMKSFDYYYRAEGVEVEKNGEKYLSMEIPLVGETAGKDVYHRMQSVRLGQAANQFTSATFCESQWSKPTLVAENVVTGIEKTTEVGKKSATVFMQGDNLVINNPAGEEVHIFGMNGAELNADKSGNASIKMAMPADNSFIVKVGKQSIKIAVIK
ncbi:hypothetical protein [uncultured Prevotella sp.]|uniref:hypothetical protein n=1 Tax=uncultured Prevotella sp. TaxID=159272 RepID=UPI002598B549|nr:hypothetical protein [uncultured Prevotella sp.]